MLTILWIILAVAAYIAFAVALAKFMGMNNYGRARETHTMLKRWNRRTGPRDRRRRQTPIAAERRRGHDRRRWAGQRGAVAVFITVCMALFILPIVALALGVGGLHVEKTRGQAVADAAALGAASALYNAEPRPAFCDPGIAAAVAAELVTKNNYDLPNGNGCTTVLGHYNLAARTFTPGALGGVPDWENTDLATVYADTFYTNAARVTCTVEGELFFLNITHTGTATATAMKRIIATEGGGVEHARGSALVQ